MSDARSGPRVRFFWAEAQKWNAESHGKSTLEISGPATLFPAAAAPPTRPPCVGAPVSPRAGQHSLAPFTMTAVPEGVRWPLTVVVLLCFKGLFPRLTSVPCWTNILRTRALCSQRGACHRARHCGGAV